MRRAIVLMGLTVFLAAGCGDDAPSSSSTTTTSTSSTTTTTSTSSTSTTSTTTTSTTEPSAPACDPTDVTEALDAALSDARLAPGGEWSTDVESSRFAELTARPDAWADVLGLDCGTRLTQPDAPGDRLALVAWTGPRLAFVVRTTDLPEPAFRLVATVSVGFEFPVGEFVRDDNSLWGGVLESGDVVVVGHLDFNLGVAAKTFAADAPPFGEAEPVLDAERAAIAAVRAAGGRNVGIAQPAEFGSEEGYVMFVSPSGQILIVDVAPAGWFDPMVERYYHGATTVRTLHGVDVRVTEPGPGEGEFDQGVEVGWACGEYVWILEPGGNGTGDEMVDFVDALIAANDC